MSPWRRKPNDDWYIDTYLWTDTDSSPSCLRALNLWNCSYELASLTEHALRLYHHAHEADAATPPPSLASPHLAAFATTGPFASSSAPQSASSLPSSVSSSSFSSSPFSSSPSQSLTAATPHGALVREECALRGLGVFCALANGCVHATFFDRTLLRLDAARSRVTLLLPDASALELRLPRDVTPGVGAAECHPRHAALFHSYVVASLCPT
jgi:hypothetical protein